MKFRLAVVIAVLTVFTLTAVPAQAAVNTKASCVKSHGVVTCTGVQIASKSIRGYGKITASSGSHGNVMKVVLQRRVCGGAWHNWTTRTDREGAQRAEARTTQWVVKPARVQFRTKVNYRVTSKSTQAAFSINRTSRVYGAC